MKLFSKILFWVYFTIASAALVVVVVYLISHYRSFEKEFRYQSQLKDFSKYFLYLEKTDSTFTSLFNVNTSQAVDFLNRSESFFDHIDYKSSSVQINTIDLANLDSLFRKWPKRYQDIVKGNLLGIYILDTARFNGLTQIIPSSNNRFIIYLNSKLFKQRPNTWITNESTMCLKNEFKSRVRYELYSERENISIKTVEHVLIHEFSHIISLLDADAPLPDGSFIEKHGYYPLIESCFDGGLIKYNSLKPALSKFAILSNKDLDTDLKLDINEFKELNKALSLSPFPTPYSTRNATELVAESLTLYIHQYYQHNKFLIIFDNSDTTYFAQKIDTAYAKNILK